MTKNAISYQEFCKEVQNMLDKVNALLSKKRSIAQPAPNENTYEYYEKRSTEEKQPFSALYNDLQSALDENKLSQLLDQYKILQPKNNPYFTDKLPITHELYDLYREIQGLTTEQINTLLQLKYLLEAKHNLDFAIRFHQNFSDKLALKICQINNIHPYTSSYLRTIATEYQNGGYELSLNIMAELQENELPPKDFAIIKLKETYPIAALELYRTALLETNTRYTAPLLYLNCNLIQRHSVEDYREKIKTILDKQDPCHHYALLSATDSFFHQICLSSAIGLDNSNAALAFIDVIEHSKALSPQQKNDLLNYRSRNMSPNWRETIYSSTPLLLAIQRGNKKVVDVLLNSEFIDLNLSDLSELTPLDWAFIMADESVCKALLQKGANPMICYYRNYSWQDEHGDPKKAPPEYRQLKAHFWDSIGKLYAMRKCSPKAEICDELLHSNPPSIEFGFLPDPFKSDFQDHIDALIRQQKILMESKAPIDQNLSYKLLGFFNLIKVSANIYATTLNSDDAVDETKVAAFTVFKKDMQKGVRGLKTNIETQFVPHQHPMKDHLIIVVNDLLGILNALFKHINETFLYKTPQPMTKIPLSFFESNICTERLVMETSSRCTGILT